MKDEWRADYEKGALASPQLAFSRTRNEKNNESNKRHLPLLRHRTQSQLGKLESAHDALFDAIGLKTLYVLVLNFGQHMH